MSSSDDEKDKNLNISDTLKIAILRGMSLDPVLKKKYIENIRNKSSKELWKRDLRGKKKRQMKLDDIKRMINGQDPRVNICSAGKDSNTSGQPLIFKEQQWDTEIDKNDGYIHDM